VLTVREEAIEDGRGRHPGCSLRRGVDRGAAASGSSTTGCGRVIGQLVIREIEENIGDRMEALGQPSLILRAEEEPPGM